MKTIADRLTERLEIRLSVDTLNRLRNLRKRTKAVSTAEVVREALKEYESSLNTKDA